MGTFLSCCVLILRSQTYSSLGFDENGDGSVILIKRILSFLGGVAQCLLCSTCHANFEGGPMVFHCGLTRRAARCYSRTSLYLCASCGFRRLQQSKRRRCTLLCVLLGGRRVVKDSLEIRSLRSVQQSSVTGMDRVMRTSPRSLALVRTMFFDSPPECSRRLKASSCPPSPTVLSPQHLVIVVMMIR